MCGRYVQVSKVSVIEKKFNVKATAGLSVPPNHNVSAGDLAPVITSENPKELQAFTFGFTPSWSEKKTYVINARAEGDQNKANDPKYTGSKGIIQKPFFRSSIRSKRCLVIADAFIEGTTEEKLSKPYLVYLLNKNRPIAFAGVYDQWTDKITGEILNTFAIITCPPNDLMQKIPHHRMPVILKPEDYSTYLDQSASLQEITTLLAPYDTKLMNAYPINTTIKNSKLKGPELIDAIGDRLQKEHYIKIENKLVLQGMGMTNSRRLRLDLDEDENAL